MLQFTPNTRNAGSLNFTTNSGAVLASAGFVEATQAEAEAGAIQRRYMSPLRTKQAIQGGEFFTANGTGAVARTLIEKLRETYVTPEDFDAVGDAVTDDTLAVQKALDSGYNVYLPNLYKISSTLTIPAAFTGKSIIGQSNGRSFITSTANIPYFTFDSTAGEISRVTMMHVGFAGTAAGSSEGGILFTGANLIQHNTFSHLRFFNFAFAFKDTTTSKVNWTIFNNIQIQATTQRGYWSTKGSGTGNIFSNWTALIATSGIEIGDASTDVGDLIFSNLHIGGTGTGIKLTAGASYGHLVTINGCQFDAGLTTSLHLINMQRVTGGGNNFGGSTTWTMTGCTGINLMFSQDVTPAQITSTQANYDPTDLAHAAILRISSDAARSISGLARGFDGRSLRVVNAGGFAITLLDSNGGSSAANQFYFGSRPVVLGLGEHIDLVYDGSVAKWQGARALPSTGVTAGSYGSATASPTYTVDAQGRLTAAANVTITPAASSITGTLGSDHGGTGVANNASSTITISGNFGTTFTVTGTTSVTLPTSGTLAALSGANTWTGRQTINDTTTTPLILIRAADTVGPFMLTRHQPTTAAVNDSVGGYTFQGRDSGGNVTSYAGFSVICTDPTDTTEDARFQIETIAAGATGGRLFIGGNGGGVFVGGSATGGDLGAGTLNVEARISADAEIQFESYTVATLPAGATGDAVFATNVRVSGEGAGVGTGGIVSYNGTAWKVAGTNVTAAA